MTNQNDSSENAHRGTWRALRVGFDSAVARRPEALQAEGFGVITQIDLASERFVSGSNGMSAMRVASSGGAFLAASRIARSIGSCVAESLARAASATTSTSENPSSALTAISDSLFS
jgi:hypothetical protein